MLALFISFVWHLKVFLLVDVLPTQLTGKLLKQLNFAENTTEFGIQNKSAPKSKRQLQGHRVICNMLSALLHSYSVVEHSADDEHKVV